MPSEHRSSHMPAAKRSMSMQENLGANGVKMPAVAAPVQCVIIPEVSKKPLPDQEVWEEVAYYLEDVSIARDHLKWMKEYLSRNEMKRKSFKTYEDVGDFLMEKANRQFNTTYHAAAETAGEDKNEQGEQADKGSGMAGLFNSGMMGLVKYLALFSAVQGMIPGAQAQGLPGNGPLALGDGATHGGGAGITSFPQICPPMSTMGNATNSTALTPLPQCPVPQPLSSPSYNVGSLLNLLPLERGLTTQTGAGMIRGMGVYKDKIGLNKAQEDRTIAPEEIDFLEGASSEEFIGRFTPYALSVLKSSRVAETEKANAMAHFNYQAYLSGNQGEERAKEMGDAHERFEKVRPQEGVKSESLPDSIADRINNARARVLAQAYKKQMPGINEQVALGIMLKFKLTFDAYREKVTSSPLISLQPFVQRDFVDVLFERSYENGDLAKAVPHDRDYIKNLPQEKFQEYFITPLARLWHDYGTSELFTKAEMEELLAKDPSFPERERIPIDELMMPETPTAK